MAVGSPRTPLSPHHARRSVPGWMDGCSRARCRDGWTGPTEPAAPLQEGGERGWGSAQPDVVEVWWGWQDGGPGSARRAPGDSEYSRGLCVQPCAVGRMGLQETLSGFPLVDGDATNMAAGSTLFLKILFIAEEIMG